MSKLSFSIFAIGTYASYRLLKYSNNINNQYAKKQEYDNVPLLNSTNLKKQVEKTQVYRYNEHNFKGSLHIRDPENIVTNFIKIRLP